MLVQVYGTEAVSRKCFYDCFKRVRDRKETTEDEPRSGRPSTSRTPDMIERVRQMLVQDRRVTLRLMTRNWALTSTRCTPSSAKISVSGRSVPGLCCTSWQTNRKQNGWKLLEISLSCVTRIHPFCKPSSQVTRPDPTSSIRNSSGKRWNGVHSFPATQKESPAKVQGQDNVDRLLRQRWHHDILILKLTYLLHGAESLLRS